MGSNPIPATNLYEIMNCKKHPKYKAIRFPVSGCDICKKNYYKRQLEIVNEQIDEQVKAGTYDFHKYTLLDAKHDSLMMHLYGGFMYSKRMDLRVDGALRK